MIFRAGMIVLASLVLQQERAWGSSYSDNRGLMPVGELEAFMSNTGIAMSGSTGAVMYNPAGLAGTSAGRVSLSANAYMRWDAQMNPVQTIDGTDLDFSTKGLQAVPHTFVSTMRTEPWTFAFSIIIPQLLKLEDSLAYSSPAYPIIQLSRTNYFQLMMAGASIATRYNNHYDVGAGCFYTIYQTAQMMSFTGGTKTGGVNAMMVTTFFRSEVSGLLCNAGIQKQLSETLRFGLTAQMPFVSFMRSGTASNFIQNPNNGMSAGDGPRDVHVEYRLPLDVGLGFEYRFLPGWRGYLDISYQQGESYETGDFGDSMVNNKAVARYSAGLSYEAMTNMHVYAGLAYNPSAVIENESNFAEDYVKGSVGVNWLSGNSNVGVGLMMARSSGSKSAPVYSASFEQTGRKPAQVRTEAFGVLISSGYVF